MGAAIGVVPRDRIVTGERDRAGRRRDRRALERPALERLHARAPGAARARAACRSTTRPPSSAAPLADELLEPTEIYVRAALDLLRSELDVHGLAHITGDGLLNLLRLNADVGYRDRRAARAAADLRADPASAATCRTAEMWEVFNMGTGLLLRGRAGERRAGARAAARVTIPAPRAIGEVTDSAGTSCACRAPAWSATDDGLPPNGLGLSSRSASHR